MFIYILLYIIYIYILYIYINDDPIGLERGRGSEEECYENKMFHMKK